MRINDKILLDNIEDYFNHKGLSPHLIDDIKEKVNTDIKNSEKRDQNYIEYKGKSPAQIILMIQRNLFALQLNPVIFFILNFILISYLYDKQYVQFQAITGMSLFYCLIIFPMTIVVCLRVSKKNYLRSNKLEMIMGTVIAIISLFLIVLQAFNIAWGVIPITNFGHQFFFFVGIILVIVGIFYKHLEFSGIGLLFCQKTIDAMIHNPQTAQVFSLIIWMLLVILVIYFTIRLSSRTRV